MLPIYLTGPTASGKTALGIALALEIGAEIVSMDSMALYRGMEIGTAAPTPRQRALVPHHLVGFLDPDREYSLADYLRDAAEAVRDIESRGKRALFLGGTPLYLKGLLRGLFEGPPSDPDFREDMLRQARLHENPHNPGWLHDRLRQVDPAAAERLHPNDTRRLIRALEVHRATGIPISCWQQQFDRPVPREDCRVFVLDPPREILYDRINRRVDAMLDAGLLEEAQRLWDRLGEQRDGPTGDSTDRRGKATAAQALGYREFFEYFEGKSTIEETVEAIKRHTRQFAKRQGTWFRSLEECRFLRCDDSTDLQEFLRQILTQL